MKPPRHALAVLLLVLATGACGGSGRAAKGSADDISRILEAIGMRGGSVADDGARLGGRPVPAAPGLRAQISTRAQSLAGAHLADLDEATAQRVLARACRLRDAALPLVTSLRDPDRAVEQALVYVQGQLEVRPEQKARALARDLVEAGSTLDVVELLASSAVCA